MSFTVKTSFVGITETLSAINDLADDTHGRKWKKDAFEVAGRKAFKPVVDGAKQRAPFGKNNTGKSKATAGLTRRSIRSVDVFNTNPSIAIGKYTRGKLGKVEARSRYTISTALFKTFENAAPKYQSGPRKGKEVRYPFMNELGVEPGTYQRKTPNGVGMQTVNRKAPRNPLYFQNRSLEANTSTLQVTFSKEIGKAIDNYANARGRTLRQTNKG